MSFFRVFSCLVALPLCAAFFFSPGAALANPEMAGQMAAARFEAMDANKDGKVSREEFFAAQPNMKEGAFAALDADNDGAISLPEWGAFAKGHGGDGHEAAPGGMSGTGSMGMKTGSAPGGMSGTGSMGMKTGSAPGGMSGTGSMGMKTGSGTDGSSTTDSGADAKTPALIMPPAKQ